MKKGILLLVMSVVAVQLLLAQDNINNKRAWLDFQLVQHIGFGEWSNTDYVNNGLPSTSITEIRGVFNFRLIKPAINGFIDMGVGIMPGPEMKSLDMGRMPIPNRGTPYYLRKMISESGVDKTSAHFKFTAGLFLDDQVTDKLTVMPYFGIGGLAMSRRSYEVILKEQGSNMQYNTMYVWRKNNGEDYDSEMDTEMLGYLTGRLNFNYKINSKLGLLVGLEYTHFFDTVNFYGKYTNTFNGNIQKSIMIEGKKMNMLGISVGISFQ